MHWRNVKRIKGLSNEDLIRQARLGDEQAKNLLFQNNIPFVKKLVGKWVNHHASRLDMDEGMSVGWTAMQIAYKWYDESRGTKFTTLLGRAIVQSLKTEHLYINKKMRTRFQTVSMDDQIGDEEDDTFYKILPDDTLEDEYTKLTDSLYIAETVQHLMNALETSADEREIKILKLHIYEEKTFAEIGEIMGITRQRAQQIYKRCLNKLKQVANAA